MKNGKKGKKPVKLGSGLAGRAQKKLMNRGRQIDSYVSKASKPKRKK